MCEFFFFFFFLLCVGFFSSWSRFFWRKGRWKKNLTIVIIEKIKMIETYKEVLKLFPCQPERLLVKRFTSKDYWSWRDLTSCTLRFTLAYLSRWSVRHAKQFRVIFSSPPTYPRTKISLFISCPHLQSQMRCCFFLWKILENLMLVTATGGLTPPFHRRIQDSLKRQGASTLKFPLPTQEKRHRLDALDWNVSFSVIWLASRFIRDFQL